MTSPRLRLKLLGPFEARFHDGRLIDLKLKNARLLLSLLALSPTRRCSREELGALLWGERSEAQARQSLRQTLSVLRRHLEDRRGDILKVDRDAVAFAADLVQSDTAFLSSLGPESAVGDLERAVIDYRGDFLQGLGVHDPVAQDWLSSRRAELRAMAVKRFEWLLEAYALGGRHDDAEPVASRLIAIDPLGEDGHRALIRVHLARGKPALALRQYQRCRDLLARELSVEPAAETKALIRLATKASPLGSRTSVGDLHSTSAPGSKSSHNLPRRMTSLIGRETEVEEVVARLRRHGLVMLTGSGGAGKTRIAIEIGFRMLDAYIDGVWLVELASIEDPRLIGEAVCGALGVPVEGNRSATESAAAFMLRKEALLILDNCEHLVTAVADLVGSFLIACPSVSILATSRESLSVAGESTYRLPSLDFPGKTETITPGAAIAYSAVQLFVDRASATIDGFALTEKTAPAVASICKQVGGIPLAIELAVARLKMMGPEWLAANLHESFLTLRASSRSAPSRHQTLRTMLDWSYDLLGVEEQAMLRRLSVFTGGSTLASAKWVAAGDPLSENTVFDLLTSLVDKSLLVVDLSDEEPRYKLLETTRQYAFEKLSNAGKRRQRLAEYLIQRFAEADESWPATPTAQWLARYEPELDNLRAALEWAFGPDGDGSLGVELASHTFRFWGELSLFPERSRWCEIAMAQQGEETSRIAAGRICLARTSNSAHGDLSSFAFADQAIAIFRAANSLLGLGESLTRAGAALLTLDTVGKATPYLDEAFAVLEPLGPTKLLANCLRSKGVAAYFAGDFPSAQRLIARSAGIARTVGDFRGLASAQIALGELAFSAGDVANAIDQVREMLANPNHNRRQSALGFGNLASYLLSVDRLAEAREAGFNSLNEARALGWSAAIVRAAEHLALVAALSDEAACAARLLGFTSAFYAKGTASRELTEQITYDRLTEELSRRLSPGCLDTLVAEGESWGELQAADEASRVG